MFTKFSFLGSYILRVTIATNLTRRYAQQMNIYPLYMWNEIILK